MQRWTFMLFCFLSAFSCSREPKKTELSDDYVLIEFAARLEEDYDRIYTQPLDNTQEKTNQ